MTRCTFLRLACLFALVVGLPVQAAEDRLNVLFIAVDDLRPELGCYGASVRSPHIDRLAATGTLFTSAYCQVALCHPSRESLLSGRRPNTTRVFAFDTSTRNVLPDVVMLPQHFKNHGYDTRSFGKVFHKNGPAGEHERRHSARAFRTGGSIEPNIGRHDAVATTRQGYAELIVL